MNIENMKRLVTHLELEQEKFNYNFWVASRDGMGLALSAAHEEALKNLYECGGETVGCIAGLASAIALNEDNFKIFASSDVTGEPVVEVFETAKKWLDLTDLEAEYLFLGQEMVKLGLYDNTGKALVSATPADAIKVLQHWIDSET